MISSYEWKRLLSFLLQMNSLQQRNYCDRRLLHNFQLDYKSYSSMMESEYSRVINQLADKIQRETNGR